MREIVKGAAIVLIEVGLAALGVHPAILIVVGVTLLLGLYWSDLTARFRRGREMSPSFDGRFLKSRNGAIDSPPMPVDTDATSSSVAIATPLSTHITRATLVTTRKTAMLSLRDRRISSDEELSELKDDTEIWKDGILSILSQIGRPEDATYFDAPMTHRSKASGGYNDEHNQLLAELDEYFERLKRIIKRMAGP